MRTLGMDHGHKRIGLALSDPSGLLALPHGVFDAHPKTRLKKRLTRLIEEKEVGALVVGQPLTMEGVEGEQAEEAAAFVAWLRSWLEIPVHEIDERLTSVMAERALHASGVRSEERSGKRDAIAAAIILESWLERRRVEATTES